MVVAQLIELSLPTPEVCGSNQVIGKLLYKLFAYCHLYREDKNKRKDAGNSLFKKEYIFGKKREKKLVANF